jgi:ABC-type maltose transport system permease subunit
MADKNGTHKGSAFWQIYFPVLAAAVIAIISGLMVVLDQNTGSISRYAEISTALLVIPVIFFALIPLVASMLAIYLLQRLIKALPPITGKVLTALEKIQQVVSKFCRLLTEPVIQPSTLWSGIREIFIRKNAG